MLKLISETIKIKNLNSYFIAIRNGNWRLSILFFSEIQTLDHNHFPFKLKSINKPEFKREKKAQDLRQVSDTWKLVDLGVHLCLQLTTVLGPGRWVHVGKMVSLTWRPLGK